MIRWIKTSLGLNVIVKKKSHLVPLDHINYKQILHLLETNSGDDAVLDSLVNELEKRVANYSGVDVEIKDGEIYFKNEILNDKVMGEQIIKMIRDGYDAAPMLRFIEKLKMNPKPEAISMLWQWFNHASLTLADDGDIIGMKYVDLVNDHDTELKKKGAVYTDKHSRSFDMSPGKICEMPRDQIPCDSTECSGPGLHVGSYSYVKGSEHIVMVKVNPIDIVRVPSAHAQKMICCRYRVLDKVNMDDVDDNGFSQPVYKVDGTQLTKSEFKRNYDVSTPAPAGELDNESANHWG